MGFPNLEMSTEAMMRMGEACLYAVVDHIADLPTASCSDLEDRVEIVRALREPLPEFGTDFEPLLKFLMQHVIPKSINTAHPAYMGYIPGGGLFPSAVADLLASAVNRYVGVWYGAPAAARLEANVLEWFAELMGYPPASTRGILTTGGSLANFSAIVSARKHLLGENLTRGTLYVSNQAHHSVSKAAMLAGIPEGNIRLLETDENYRAIPERFEAAIKNDLQNGLKPFLVVGNAGTTNTGTIDPLSNLAEISQKYSLWYHIDAAYGGFFNLCKEGKRKLKGLERSDSMILDPHKGLFVPYGSGCLLVKDGERLRRAHVLSGEYPQEELIPEYLHDAFAPKGEPDFYKYSPEQSRSFRGLRVWLPLKLFGLQAFRDNLAEKLHLTQWLYQRFLEVPRFECLSIPDLSILTFRYLPQKGDVQTFNRYLLDRIIKSGKLFLSSTTLNGKFVIRVCILSFRTHQAEVEEAFEVIKSIARGMEDNGSNV